MWKRDGTPIALQPPAVDGNSIGTAINGSGEVVGRSYTTAEAVIGTRAVMWDRRRKPMVLPTLDGVNDDTDSDSALTRTCHAMTQPG